MQIDGFVTKLGKRIRCSYSFKEPNTVDPRYLDFDYLEQPLISKRKSGPSFKVEI